ncbi:hypothetical protein U1Q18_017907 [Sarracenia purpurea var. burkii]
MANQVTHPLTPTISSPGAVADDSIETLGREDPPYSPTFGNQSLTRSIGDPKAAAEEAIGEPITATQKDPRSSSKDINTAAKPSQNSSNYSKNCSRDSNNKQGGSADRIQQPTQAAFPRLLIYLVFSNLDNT